MWRWGCKADVRCIPSWRNKLLNWYIDLAENWYPQSQTPSIFFHIKIFDKVWGGIFLIYWATFGHSLIYWASLCQMGANVGLRTESHCPEIKFVIWIKLFSVDNFLKQKLNVHLPQACPSSFLIEMTEYCAFRQQLSLKLIWLQSL